MPARYKGLRRALTVRLPISTYVKIQRLSVKYGRSMSDVVAALLEERAPDDTPSD